MDRLTALYSDFLSLGLVVLRQAIQSKDFEWAEAEVELLHNVPSLINESNMERHRYFWFVERERYLEWVIAPGHETAMSRMKTFYEPLWQEMEPLLEALAPTSGRSAVVDIGLQ
jgi:hypothetical protein